MLKISDNGIGIDLKKYRTRVFGLYNRFHDHVKGKGTGLFLVKAETEALGGNIQIESEVNEGTTFKIYFPKLKTQLSFFLRVIINALSLYPLL